MKIWRMLWVLITDVFITIPLTLLIFLGIEFVVICVSIWDRDFSLIPEIVKAYINGWKRGNAEVKTWIKTGIWPK